jgi:hypothetical protein
MIHTSRIEKVGGVAAVVLLSTMLALAQPNTLSGSEAAMNSGSHQTLTGTVTCAARISHQYSCRRYDTLQSCTLSCVQTGSNFVLMVGNEPYLLQGDRKELEHFAGGKASVSGMLLGGDEIEVGSVGKPGTMPESFGSQEQPVTNAGR